MAQQSPEAARKVAAYGQRPTVFPPPGEPSRQPRSSAVLTAVRTVRVIVTSALFLAGPPVALWQATGNPLHRLPTGHEIEVWFTEYRDGLTDDVLIGLAVWALWLLWAVLALLLLADLLATLTRWRVPVLRLPAPLHRLMFGLAGSAALALTATARPDTGTATTTLTPQAAVSVPNQAVAEGPAVIYVGSTRYTYLVKRHDTLSKIARQWLGDADRWPEICALNKHRHYTTGVLRDCDLIYPGWDLRLPDDATPPATARPALPRQRTPPPDRSPQQPAPPPTTTPDSPHTTPLTPPRPSEPQSRTEAPNTPRQRPSAESDDTPAATDEGARLADGSVIPWSLAAAITAAVAMVWLHRRRRHTPGTTPPDLPEPVLDVHRQVLRNPDLPTPHDLAERAAAVPDLPLPPPDGIGLVGPGAHGAALAALTTILATGERAHPEQRGEVIVDRTTLATLLGADHAATIEPWPRLQIPDTVDDAVALLDTHVLRRARTIDETTTDPADSAADQLPPLLLICPAPTPEATNRLRISLRLGATYNIHAVLLGAWSDGTTRTVTADRHSDHPDGTDPDTLGDPPTVLDPGTAVAILTTLREAHTGEPPNTPAHLSTAAELLNAAQIGPDDAADAVPAQRQVDAPPESANGDDQPKVRLQVLGRPAVPDIHLPGRPLRGKAAELAVYLACHPNGADTETIAEYLVPEVRRRQAKQQVHTNASNLRHVLGRAGGPITGGYLLKRAATARYRLDPTTVQVDLWQLRDLLTRAQLASAPARTELLREACDLYTAPLAEGCDYEWVEPHREQVRLWGTEAHLLLADDLLESDPQAASDLLDKAIGLDRYNEELYRKAMHARHALGDTDGIRVLLRALTKALADLDAEPAEATTELAAQLRNSLDQR